MKSIKNVYEEMVNGFIQKRYEFLKETQQISDEENEMEKMDNDEEVQEEIQEPSQEPDEIPTSNGSPNINKKERIKIQTAIHKNKMLGGNLKVDSKSKALWEVGKVLSSCGFTLDMVMGDDILGPKGNNLLSFSRKSKNPYIAGTEIENARISFTWENLEPLSSSGAELKKNYEIIAYLT